ncbi:NXRD1 protein, partial [Edolisoma coerulescens]|nr:NXRD1 protein [Edolisoma coerulescens]
LVVIFYAGLNSTMWQNLPHQKALKLHNDLSFPECCLICAEQKPSCCKSFVSKDFASSFSLPRTFHWFDLTAVPLRKSLFSQLLEKRELVWCHLMPGALLYQAPSGDWPTKPCRLVSTKTPLTSAVVEPSVIFDDKPPFSTAASNSFSEIPEETAEYDSKFS